MLNPDQFKVNEAWIAVRIIEIVPLSDLEPIIGPLKELFASDFIGNT